MKKKGKHTHTQLKHVHSVFIYIRIQNWDRGNKCLAPSLNAVTKTSCHEWVHYQLNRLTF